MIKRNSTTFKTAEEIAKCRPLDGWIVYIKEDTLYLSEDFEDADDYITYDYDHELFLGMGAEEVIDFYNQVYALHNQ